MSHIQHVVDLCLSSRRPSDWATFEQIRRQSHVTCPGKSCRAAPPFARQGEDLHREMEAGERRLELVRSDLR